MRTRIYILALVVLALSALGELAAQGGGNAAPAAAPAGVRLEVNTGSRAQYRVREQLAGINFPNDVVGITNDVTGLIVIKADGTIDSAQSKIVVDLRTLKTDQDQRDRFIQGERGLKTTQFPTAEFVPKRAVGLPWPFPATPPAQAGFQLVGDLTLYGTTKEVTWNVVTTFNPDAVSGRAVTEFPFTTFGIPKPQLARLMSVDDTIHLELDVRFKRTAS